jgi:hypothetical protein
VYYFARQKRAPSWMRPTIFIFEILALIQAISVNVVRCSNVGQEFYLRYYVTTSVLFTVVIMVLSAVMMYKLSGMMTFGFLKKRIRWLWYLEVFI